MEKDKRISPKTEKVLDRLRVISFAILFLFVCVSSTTCLILAAVTADVGNSLSITYEPPPPILVSGKKFNDYLQARPLSTHSALYIYFDNITTSNINYTNVLENYPRQEIGNNIYAYSSENEYSSSVFIYILSKNDIYANPDCSYMFANLSNTSLYLDFRNFHTENVTDMSYMFYQTLFAFVEYVFNFDTSQVTNMSHMFDLRERIFSSTKPIDISSFDTSKVKNYEKMFVRAGPDSCVFIGTKWTLGHVSDSVDYWGVNLQYKT